MLYRRRVNLSGTGFGFTLLEVVAVIIIVSLLAAVALPQYSMFKQKARTGSVIKRAGVPIKDLEEQLSEGLKISFDDPNGFVSSRLALDNLRKGHVAFGAPKSIIHKEAEEVHLFFSVDKSQEELKKIVTKSAQIHGDQIEFSSVMEAKLTPSKTGLEVTPVLPEKRIVDTTKVNEWRWTVEAKSIGKYTLYLTVSALIGEKETALPVQTYFKEIIVEATPSKVPVNFLEKHGNTLMIFIALFGSVLLPIYFYKRNTKEISSSESVTKRVKATKASKRRPKKKKRGK